MMEDCLGHSSVESGAGHGKAQFGVATDMVAFQIVERAGLGEYPWIHMDLSHIVEEAYQTQAFDVVLGQVH
jgi:hypothetical protein